MMASNPWQLTNKKLMNLNGYTRNQALEEISRFLLDWTGTHTANMELEERHNRFVQIIGGYPRIDGRFPLDWPLHPDSVRALRLSRFLDTIGGSNNSSLRSRILNRDLKYRRMLRRSDLDEEDKKTLLIDVNHDCVADLLKHLRLFNCDDTKMTLDSPIDIHEERLLISLHSLDASQLEKHWPWEKMGKEIKETHHYSSDLGDNSPEGQEIFQARKIHGEDSKQFMSIKNRKEAWEHYKFFETDVEFIFEYAYIKTWMRDHWLKCWVGSESADSLGQRLLRGLSTICELAISRIRQMIITKYGLGSIIIDGGGRISFVVPESEVESAEKNIRETFERTFLIDRESRERPYLEHDINQALTYHLNIGNRESKYPEGDRLHYSDYDENVGKTFVLESMPPRRFYAPALLGDNSDGDDDDGNIQPLPEINSMVPKDCEMCNCSVENWDRISNDISNHKYSICMMHRLIFVIGTNQRIRDSLLRDSKKPMGYLVGKKEKSASQSRRRVHSVATLDGNSCGIFFQQPGVSNNNFLSFDVRRRRSFRFNSTWYCALQEGFEETKKYGSDRIAAWVSAGDDIVLAQYGPMKESQYSEKANEPMKSFMKKFSESLEDFEESGLKLTFAGGMAIRTDEGIHGAYRTAYDNEKIAKHVWKNEVKSLGQDRYLETTDGKMKIFDETILTISSDQWYPKTPSMGPRSLFVTKCGNRIPKNIQPPSSRKIMNEKGNEEEYKPPIME